MSKARTRGVPFNEPLPDSRTMAAADHRQRMEWMRCAKTLGNLEEEIRDLAKELAGKRKQHKRLVKEMVRAGSEDRLPLFEAQFEGGKR